MKQFLFVSFTLLFLSCRTVSHITNVKESQINISEIQPDIDVQKMIAPYKAQLDGEMNTVIGNCEQTLTKRRPESTLGNWFCDVMAIAAERNYADKPAFVVQNYGGLRIPNITKGEVTKRKIYELMPFDNLLVLVQVDYSELMKFIEQMAASGGWPQSKSLRYEIVDGKPTQITIDGESPDNDKKYWIGMPDYIANGGDNAFYLTDNPRLDNGIFLRDAAIEQIIENTEHGIPIQAKLDARVTSNN